MRTDPFRRRPAYQPLRLLAPRGCEPEVPRGRVCALGGGARFISRLGRGAVGEGAWSSMAGVDDVGARGQGWEAHCLAPTLAPTLAHAL